MAVHEFPQARRRATIGSVPPFTRLTATRPVRAHDADGREVTLPEGTRLSVESASTFSVAALSSHGPIWVRLEGSEFDALEIDLPR